MKTKKNLLLLALGLLSFPSANASDCTALKLNTCFGFVSYQAETPVMFDFFGDGKSTAHFVNTIKIRINADGSISGATDADGREYVITGRVTDTQLVAQVGSASFSKAAKATCESEAPNLGFSTVEISRRISFFKKDSIKITCEWN